VPDLVAQIEAEARRRFVHWDPALWSALVGGPAHELAAALERAGQPPERSGPLLESYLRLACEGIGQGLIVPASAGASTFTTLAWTRLLPDSLASLPPGRQAGALADCWNLGENLEASPFWLRRLFLRSCAGLTGVADLPALVERVERKATKPPARRLGSSFESRWVPLAEDDRRFLPGALHFLAPSVICVHDRHRGAAGDRDAGTAGVFLDDPPLALGAMGCDQQPANDPGLDMDLLEALSRRDPRVDDWHAMAANDWWAAVTLTTSQFLVVLAPT
jgi:hypothetical protein